MAWVLSDDVELDQATDHVARIAEAVGLIRPDQADAWRRLDELARRVTGRDPNELTPRQWLAIAAWLRETQR